MALPTSLRTSAHGLARALAALALVACTTTAACTTTRSVEPAGLANARAQHLMPERTWQVVEHGEARGVVVQFASTTEAQAPRSVFFSVQNTRRQELGMIDAQGRAWRYEVHQREARWLSTGTLLDGARAILGADSSTVLVEFPVECEPASSPAQ